MIRAGHKTIKGFGEQAVTLLDLSTECNLLSEFSPLDRLGRSSIPHGWDSSAFCVNLQEATRSYPAQVINQVTGAKSLQARAFQLLYSAGEPWTKFIHKRISMFHSNDMVTDPARAGAG